MGNKEREPMWLMILVYMVGIIYSIYLLILLNPLIWGIWATISPKSAVNFLKKGESCTWLPYHVCSFCFFLDEGILILLPWKTKKTFYQTFGLDRMSDRQLAKAYRKKDGLVQLKHLTEGARDILWERSNKYWSELSEGVLSRKQFQDLVADKRDLDLERHLVGGTPSTEKMEVLLKAAAKDKDFRRLVTKLVINQGLHPSLIKDVFTQVFFTEIKSLVESALVKHRQIQDVKSIKGKTEWEEYLRKTEQLCPEAQLHMQTWMLSAYLKPGDKGIDRDILWSWIQIYEKKPVLLNYVKGLIESEKASEALKAYVKADAWWSAKI